MFEYEYESELEIPFTVVAGLWHGYDKRWSTRHDLTSVVSACNIWQTKQRLNIVHTFEELHCTSGAMHDGRPAIEDGVRITGSLPSQTSEEKAWELLKDLAQAVFGPAKETTVIVTISGRPRRLRPLNPKPAFEQS